MPRATSTFPTLRTTALLLVHPGALDRAIHDGARVRYFKPISLFLLINVLFVMLSPINDFYVSLYEQLNFQPYSSWTRPWVEQLAVSKGLSLDEFATLYNQLVHVLARSLIIAQVPFFALAAALLMRKPGYYAADHLTFALNAHSWLMVLIVVAQIPSWLIGLGIAAIGVSLDADLLYLLSLPVGFFVYTWMAGRRLYQLSHLSMAWKTPLFLLALFASHMGFRFCQLIITALLVGTDL